MGMGERPVTQLTGSGGHFLAHEGKFGSATPGGNNSRRVGKSFAFKNAGHGEEMPDDIGFLADAGMARSTLEWATRIAREKGLLASDVLIARGWLDRDHYGEMLARHVGAQYLTVLDSTKVMTGSDLAQDEDRPVLCGGRLIVPATGFWASKLVRLQAKSPQGTAQIAIASPLAIKLALHQFNRAKYLGQASDGPGSKFQEMSAKNRLTPAQLVFVCLAAAGILLAALLPTTVFGLAVGLLLTVFYLVSVLFRALLVWRMDTLPPMHADAPKFPSIASEDLPVDFHPELGQVSA